MPSWQKKWVKKTAGLKAQNQSKQRLMPEASIKNTRIPSYTLFATHIQQKYAKLNHMSVHTLPPSKAHAPQEPSSWWCRRHWTPHCGWPCHTQCGSHRKPQWRKQPHKLSRTLILQNVYQTCVRHVVSCSFLRDCEAQYTVNTCTHVNVQAYKQVEWSSSAKTMNLIEHALTSSSRCWIQKPGSSNRPCQGQRWSPSWHLPQCVQQPWYFTSSK